MVHWKVTYIGRRTSRHQGNWLCKERVWVLVLALGDAADVAPSFELGVES
jgi:hypothetical protein